MPRVVVVGSDTEVGKTFVSCALLRALRERVAVVGLKPVESGVGPEGPADARALGDATGVEGPWPRYAFVDPVSPHLAARREGVEVELDEIASWVAAHEAPWTLVETAGGLMSPLSGSLRNRDLVRGLEAWAVIVVVPNRLGALHHALACEALLEGVGAEVAVVLNRGEGAVAESNLVELAGLAPTAWVGSDGEVEELAGILAKRFT